MKISTRTFSAIAIAIARSASAGAATFHGKAFDLTKHAYKPETLSVFNTGRIAEIDRLNGRMAKQNDTRFRAQADGQTEPFKTFGPANMTTDLDAPGGERWYYVANFDYEEIPPNEDEGIYYTDHILREYTFDIYDADMKLVGTIKDKMEYRDKEVRSVMNDLAPVVTRNFFNDDDKLEVIVGLGINTTYQQNSYRSVVYQIGGEKKDGYDQPIMTFESLITDVVEGPAEGGKDCYYMTFSDEFYPTAADDDSEGSFWEYLCGAHITIDVYGPARGTGAPQKVLSKKVPLLQLPGDQMSTPYVMSFTRGGDVYFVISSLEEPFYNEYNDPINDDLTQRTDNKLVVEFFKSDGKGGFALDYDTRIPFTVDNEDGVLASYYSIGNLRYRQDIDFDHFGTPEGRAALFVTKENYTTTSDDMYVKSYYVYDHTGKRIRTLAEGCETAITLSDLPGHEPQAIFATADVYAYYFDFVDLVSGKTVMSISNQYEINEDSDPESLTANFDRVADGDSYMYVNELRMPGIDENENDIMRFLWLKKDGSFDHIDQVNMGQHVMYALSYLSTVTLDPKAFHSDDTREYMMLIKRGTQNEDGTMEAGTREELLIGQVLTADKPEGNTLLLVLPDERGILNGIVPYIDTEHPDRSSLLVTYYDATSNLYAQDYYPLPLDRKVSGITDAEISAPESAINIIGTTVRAEGKISVYNPAGALVAAGRDSIDLAGLGAGIYIVRAADSARKFIIK